MYIMRQKTIQDLLPFVEKPSRYLGTEINRVCKKADPVDVSIALAFPDLYEIGTSHFGMQILYDILNQQSGISAERVFAPADDMAAALRSASLPLCSLESGKPLNEFDIIGFSLLYELNYTNILTILDLSDIPFMAAERDDTYPLIIAGGPATCNPEPVADFFDAMVIGEGEQVITEIVQTWLSVQSSFSKSDPNTRRKHLLDALSGLESVYVPQRYQVRYDDSGFQYLSPLSDAPDTIRRAMLEDLDTASFPEKPVVPYGRPVHDRLRLEIARGCTRGCRFCQAGMIYRPVRERTVETLLEQADSALNATGYEDISLLSLSTGDYGNLTPLMSELMACYAGRNIAVSLPSLRAGTLDPTMMELIRSVRKTGFTIAPEAGTQRLRDVINKNIQHDEIIDTVKNAFALGWQVIKLYFMIGLPTETDADLQGIVDLVKEIRALPGKRRQRKINVTVTTFIPKPHVPFQWAAQISQAAASEKIMWLKKNLRLSGVFIKSQDPEISQFEGLFARGDRRLNRLLIAAHEKGCRFDGWTDHFNYAAWQSALTETGIDISHYTIRERTLLEPLPWDHIDNRVHRSYLEAEWRKATNQVLTDDCRTGACNDCGVCDFKQIKPVVHPLRPTPERPSNESASKPIAATRYQLAYAKTGDARFFGHLELVNILFRAIRRAGIPVQYTEGFHPKPKISFANPLPVGIESEWEPFALSLTEHMKPFTIREKLNTELPDGISIPDCRIQTAQSKDDTIPDTLYHVFLNQAEFDPARIMAFKNATHVNFSRTNRKGKLQNFDLKAMVSDIRLEGGVFLKIAVRNDIGPSARITDVIQHIFNLPDDTVKRARFLKKATHLTEADG